MRCGGLTKFRCVTTGLTKRSDSIKGEVAGSGHQVIGVIVVPKPKSITDYFGHPNGGTGSERKRRLYYEKDENAKWSFNRLLLGFLIPSSPEKPS